MLRVVLVGAFQTTPKSELLLMARRAPIFKRSKAPASKSCGTVISITKTMHDAEIHFPTTQVKLMKAGNDINIEY